MKREIANEVARLGGDPPDGASRREPAPGMMTSKSGSTATAIALRVFLASAPLAGLYLYAQYAFGQARAQEHRGDTGLGIAILLAIVCVSLILSFLVDLMVQIARKRIAASMTSLLILAVLCVPLGWFGCNWFDLRGSMVCEQVGDAFGAFLGLFEKAA
ncbi:hypothetical protein GLA29479_2656 [Lysobacter antibioticus]|uniref:hypothetical protein n=1 Tax=Lysobacter antibioticus TaxID=84531 RepID=UPI000720287E|nr:hypothetical protein [Lysobacter antibioticus]ALN63522.1 hypothetical protein GLA29479_2656 [Lysobacter antibioticus]